MPGRGQTRKQFTGGHQGPAVSSVGCAAADQKATEADPGTVMLAAVDDNGRRIGCGFVDTGGAIRVYLNAYPPPVALTVVPLEPRADEL
ncbi:MAG: hypothetical protein MJE77_38665 [Proteobacteria bacterium]|nr:hypothetical protein [Pseudomonadota bacterium]